MLKAMGTVTSPILWASRASNWYPVCAAAAAAIFDHWHHRFEADGVFPVRRDKVFGHSHPSRSMARIRSESGHFSHQSSASRVHRAANARVEEGGRCLVKDTIHAVIAIQVVLAVNYWG